MKNMLANAVLSPDDGMAMIFVLILLGSVILFGSLGCWVGGLKRRGKEGAILGALLGPIGLIVAVLLPPGEESKHTATAMAMATDQQSMILHALLGLSALLGVFIMYVKYLDKIYAWFQ